MLDKLNIDWLNGSSYLSDLSIPWLSKSGLLTFLKYPRGISVLPKLYKPFKLPKINTDLPKGSLINPTNELIKKQNSGNTMNTIGQIADGISTILPEKSEYEGDKGYIAQSLDSAYDQIEGKVPPQVAAIMKLNKIGGQVLNNLGGGTDGMTTQDAILGSSFLGPLGSINGFTGKRAETFVLDDEALENVGSDYGGFTSLAKDALSKSNKKYGGLSSGARHSANRLIREALRLQEAVSDISDNSLIRNNIVNSMLSNELNKYNYHLNGGYNNIYVGKQGMKIERIKKIINKYLKSHPVVENRKDDSSEIELVNPTSEFKEGGTIQYTEIELINPFDLPEFKEGGSINVIPEGALHARLHHMENDENITKKGIPVVSLTEDGKIEQQAEIERNEIIFRLEVTKKLEELELKYYDYEHSLKEKDELAIEAGKLLVEEILHNTQDNTGILNENK